MDSLNIFFIYLYNILTEGENIDRTMEKTHGGRGVDVQCRGGVERVLLVPCARVIRTQLKHITFICDDNLETNCLTIDKTARDHKNLVAINSMPMIGEPQH